MYKSNGFLTNMWKYFKKYSFWPKLAIFLAILFLLVREIQIHRPIREGFIQEKEFILKKGPEIYDDFYVDIYDKLVFSDFKNQFEIGEIINKTSPTEQSSILDIGSGTGHHVDAFTKKGFKTLGIDTSPAMIKNAKEKFPSSDFKVADTYNTMAFPANSFTHILCLYFTIYYIKNKSLFFKNCYQWLLPGGEMVVHLVNRAKFDPLIPKGSPFAMLSPQKYTDKRITKSSIKFKEFQYKSNFDLKDDIAIFDETFKDDNTGHVRKNEHKLYMETQTNILSLAKNAGFILKEKDRYERMQI